MRKILHILGVHDWKYKTPTSEKITEPEFFGSALTGGTYTGKYRTGYAYFQKATCNICSKNKIERVDH